MQHHTEHFALAGTASESTELHVNLPLNKSSLTSQLCTQHHPCQWGKAYFLKNLAQSIAGHDSEDEDIAAQLGVGSLAADVELDALKDAAEGEIVGMKSLLGRYAPLLAALCHNR